MEASIPWPNVELQASSREGDEVTGKWRVSYKELSVYRQVIYFGVKFIKYAFADKQSISSQSVDTEPNNVFGR